MCMCAQEAYQAEGVPWEPIPYADNAPIIALLEATPHGVYPILDSQCRAPDHLLTVVAVRVRAIAGAQHPT